MGWLLLCFGASLCASSAGRQYVAHTHHLHPLVLPHAANVVANLAGGLWHPTFGFLVFLMLLFPGGRLLSSRWKPVALTTAGVYGALALAGVFSHEHAATLFPYSRPLFHGSPLRLANAVFDLLLAAQLLLLLIGGIALAVRLARSKG